MLALIIKPRPFGILMRRLAVEPRSAAGLSFSSQCPSLTIFDGAELAGFKSRANYFVLV